MESESKAPSKGEGQRGGPRRWLGPFLLFSSSLLVCVFLAEGMVRIVAPQQLFLIRPDVYQPVDSLGWKFRPNLSTDINTGEGTVSLFTDHRGFRIGRDGAVQSDRTVVVLGDSFMAALQVEYEDSFPGLMQSELAGLDGGPVGVRNTGVGAWDPPHYLMKIRRVLASEVPEVAVVAVYLGNDVVERGVERFEPRKPYSQPRLSIPRSVSPGAWLTSVAAPIDFQLRRISHLYVLLRSQLVELRMRMGLSSIYFPEEYLASEAQSSRWDTTAAILGEIAYEASQYGVPVLFVLIPTHFQVLEEDLARHVNAFGLDTLDIRIDQPNEFLGDRLRQRGLEVLDPLPMLREAASRGEIPYGMVDTHYNEVGHRLTWEFVRDRVLEYLEGERMPSIREAPDGY